MIAHAVPPWIEHQLQSLLMQRGHAWLLQGPSGLGQYTLALALARAWLCDHPSPQGACGRCASCHAIDVRTHADLCVLMPETQMMALDWPLSEKAQAEIDDKKRKPSKEIRVEAMRDAVEFSQRTNARGKGKVMLVFPAEQMNQFTASALLKTLEEPPGDIKFILASESAHQLLPTIRSRCIGHTMLWPDAVQATAWLEKSGMAVQESAFFLNAAGGRPEDAFKYQQAGLTAKEWSGFPQAMARGNVAYVKDWTPVQLLDALQKLCHDVLVHHFSAPCRFFAAADLPQHSHLGAITQWSKALLLSARTVEHPFNSGLMQEALVGQAQSALNSRQ